MLARPDWEPERNRAVYGKCANPAGHGHNYGLEVRVRGLVREDSGRIVSLEELDRVVRERVLGRLEHRFLNREVPEFETRVPTVENIARFIWEALHDQVAPGVLDRVRVVETENNAAEYSGDDDGQG